MEFAADDCNGSNPVWGCIREPYYNWRNLSICSVVWLFIEPTCAYAWWAHMHRFLSFRLSVTRPKLLDNNSYLRNHLKWGLPNVVWWWTLIVSRSCMKVEVIGQRSRSPRQKCYFHGFCIVYLANDLWGGGGQRSRGSRSMVTWVKHGLATMLHYQFWQGRVSLGTPLAMGFCAIRS